MTDYKESYAKFAEAQKNMYEAWAEVMTLMDKDGNMKFPAFDPADMYKNFEEANTAFLEKMKSTPRDVYEKMKESTDSYYELYKMWETAAQNNVKPGQEKMTEIYNEWKENYGKKMRENYLAYLPESIRGISDKAMNLSQSYVQTTGEFWEPWKESAAEMNDAFMRGFTMDSSSYMDYLEAWKKSYDATYSKILKMPAIGIQKESIKRQMDSADKYYNMAVIMNSFYGRIYQIANDTTEQVFKDYFDLLEEGKEPKTYDEFYRYWSKAINKAYDKLFFSDDFSKLAGETVNAMSDFKLNYDRMLEDYVSYWPVPKKSDMDSLYKTVYDLKKEVRSTTKEIKELKEELAKLTAASATKPTTRTKTSTKETTEDANK